MRNGWRLPGEQQGKETWTTYTKQGEGKWSIQMLEYSIRNIYKHPQFMVSSRETVPTSARERVVLYACNRLSSCWLGQRWIPYSTWLLSNQSDGLQRTWTNWPEILELKSWDKGSHIKPSVVTIWGHVQGKKGEEACSEVSKNWTDSWEKAVIKEPHVFCFLSFVLVKTHQVTL